MAYTVSSELGFFQLKKGGEERDTRTYTHTERERKFNQNCIKQMRECIAHETEKSINISSSLTQKFTASPGLWLLAVVLGLHPLSSVLFSLQLVFLTAANTSIAAPVFL